MFSLQKLVCGGSVEIALRQTVILQKLDISIVDVPSQHMIIIILYTHADGAQYNSHIVLFSAIIHHQNQHWKL